MQTTPEAIANTASYRERLNSFQLYDFPSLATSCVFLIKPPALSDKWLKLLPVWFKFRVQRGWNSKMIIQSVSSKQIIKFTIQMKHKCSAGQRSCWSSLVDCIPSGEKKSSAFKIWAVLTARNTPLGNSKQILPEGGSAHSFQIRNSPWSFKQRKSSSFPMLSHMNHFPLEKASVQLS